MYTRDRTYMENMVCIINFRSDDLLAARTTLTEFHYRNYRRDIRNTHRQTFSRLMYGVNHLEII